MEYNKVFILPKEGPFCPIHKGQMKLNFPADWFECLGWDGEGCPYKVTMEEVMIEIGTTGDIKFGV